MTMCRIPLVLLTLAVGCDAFDFDSGNVLIEALFPALLPWTQQDISSGFGDAPLVLRLTTMLTNAWFDATAPYDETAVGVYSRFDRRPVEDRTIRSVNVAVMYAARPILREFFPGRLAEIDAFLDSIGIDVLSADMDVPTTAAGIGTIAGTKVAEGRRYDGMNSAGDFMRERHFEPFMDTTGYAPVNTAYALNNPSKWQPDMQRKGLGLYKIQQFVTPQWGITEPYAYSNPNAWQVPPPVNSNVKNKALYKKQVDEVLAASAGLTEEQKLKAELFDNKVRGLGFSAVFKTLSGGLNTLQFVQLDFLSNMAAFDAGIFVWNEKRRWDAVRPFSAIKHVYGDDLVSGWGGPGQGTVDMKATDWKSLFEEADHPEYPSASTCFCFAHAQSLRKYFGNDVLNYPVEWAAGSSLSEPGILPAADTTIVFPTWTEFAQDCGDSRVWGGVHFQASIDAAADSCGRFGDLAFDYFSSLMNGTAALRPPATPLPIPSFYNDAPCNDGDDNGKGKGKGKENDKGNNKGKGKGKNKGQKHSKGSGKSHGRRN
ncbi:hypothetical protein DIPPA_70219 [Diplonema papillatum]|nr:hypothetical protein DIPPA_70219 [Diplonema papillatum]